MKKVLLNIIGKILTIFHHLYTSFEERRLNTILGGGNRRIEYPFVIRGIENILMGDNVSIGPNCTIYTTGAKLILKEHIVTGPNLTIITGDHDYQVGKYIDSIKTKDKRRILDLDTTIEQDVWIGSNVTILKGVTIGESSVIAAGSVITKDVPPYSIVGGIPAHIIKSKWDEEDISSHKRFLHKREG